MKKNEIQKNLTEWADTVFLYLASNPNAPRDILVKLAKEGGKDVRKEVVTNPNTPVEVLERLAKDKNDEVRKAAKNRLSSIAQGFLRDRENGIKS